MSKKQDAATAAVEGDDKNLGLIGEEKPKTKKSLLKQAEKLVRRLDSTLSDLYNAEVDAERLVEDSLRTVTTEVDPKDMHRFTEMQNVVQSTREILYYMLERMSRKYVGKSIADFPSEGKRKALKKK